MAINVTGWLTSTITVATQSGVDSYGDPTFATAATMSARVETKQRIIVGTNGDEYQSNHVVCTASAIPLNARVWLPGDTTSDANQARRPIMVEAASDKAGATSVYLTYL